METIQGDVISIPQGLVPHLKGPDGQRHTINLDDWAAANGIDPSTPLGLRQSHNAAARNLMGERQRRNLNRFAGQAGSGNSRKGETGGRRG